MALSEAEKLAIREAFMVDLAGVRFKAEGIVDEFAAKLAPKGAAQIYDYFVRTKEYVIQRGVGSAPLAKDEIVNELVGMAVYAAGVWDHLEEIAPDGAEAIATRMAARKWVVSRGG